MRDVLLGIVCALTSLILFPPAFGATGIYFGYKVKREGKEATGIFIMVLSFSCMIAGWQIGSRIGEAACAGGF